MENVQSHLAKLAELVHFTSMALEHRQENTLMELDRQIELEFGAKERAMGALEEHRREHGCQFANPA
jgi:hypothetical protein